MHQDIKEYLRLRVKQHRSAFNREAYPRWRVRKERMERVCEMTERYTEALITAISVDFGHRSRQETLMTEIFMVQSAARHAAKHLREWMKPQDVTTAPYFWPASNKLLRQPLGVVGIMAPWNYPFGLAMAPAVAALAAGNRVLIKPSELAPTTAALLGRMVRDHFYDDEMQVITGDMEVSRAFSEMPFDHLFFTGSTSVGRAVAVNAARNLVPVTLELGGKSPVLVDRSANIELTASRLAAGKLLNAGQTCIAPDFALVQNDLVEPLIKAYVRHARRLYPTLHDNPDYTCIASSRHVARIKALLDDARIRGARMIPTHDEPTIDRKMTPCLVLDTLPAMALMQNEIFGPVLPIIPYDTEHEGLDYLRRVERPVAMYWFGTDRNAQRRAMQQTHAGGMTVNDCLWHAGQNYQPFGGIGKSGMGSYHGEWGFRTFSHEKPVFVQSRLALTQLLQPPYGPVFDRVMGVIKRMDG